MLTDKDADDGSQVGPLLDQIDGPVASFNAGGAFDRDGVHAKVAARHPDAAIIERGRLGWQRDAGRAQCVNTPDTSCRMETSRQMDASWLFEEGDADGMVADQWNRLRPPE